jgi:D-glycero-D-manno-heptose 1,7-bisphosphate phosphatase
LRAAVLVDRDGVINQLVTDPVTGNPESPLQVSDVALVSGAVDALADLRDAGFALVGISNQPAAAKGTVGRDELLAVHARVVELVAAGGVEFDAFELCLHHPDGVIPELSGACDCRKPAPGMLLRAAHALGLDLAASWMVGDTDADVVAGRRAGCRTVLVEQPGSAHKRTDAAVPHGRAADLRGAAALILAVSYPET